MRLFKYGILALLCTFMTSQARADAYLGVLGGYGLSSGDPAVTSGGVALGATAGFQLVPNLGVAGTYIHNAMKGSGGDVTVSEYLVEGNFFSLLFFPSGVHLGTVNTDYNGVSSSDLGFGAHTGFDLMIMSGISVGASVYWTYVTRTDDKHSLINLLVPVKIHF